MTQIGELLKQYRKDKNLSQLELSLKVGWENPSTLSRIEKGEVKPNRETILKISHALDLTRDYINILLRNSEFNILEPALTENYVQELLLSIDEDMKNLNYPVIIQNIDSEIFYWNAMAEKFFQDSLDIIELKNSNLKLTIVDIIFNEKYHIKQNIINWDKFINILIENIFKMSLLMPDNEKLMKQISLWSTEYLEFNNVLNNIKDKEVVKHVVYNLPFIYDHPKVGVINFSITTSFLYSDKRFVVQQIAPLSFNDAKKLEKIS